MKTALIMIVTLLMLSCENSVNTVPPDTLKPPAWILGSFDCFYNKGDEAGLKKALIEFRNDSVFVSTTYKYKTTFDDNYKIINYSDINVEYALVRYKTHLCVPYNCDTMLIWYNPNNDGIKHKLIMKTPPPVSVLELY